MWWYRGLRTLVRAGAGFVPFRDTGSSSTPAAGPAVLARRSSIAGRRHGLE